MRAENPPKSVVKCQLIEVPAKEVEIPRENHDTNSDDLKEEFERQELKAQWVTYRCVVHIVLRNRPICRERKDDTNEKRPGNRSRVANFP